MHAGKTLGRPGATPLWTAFSRPNPVGSLPACHRGTVTAFYPRAYRIVSKSEGGEEGISNTEGRNSRCQF